MSFRHPFCAAARLAALCLIAPLVLLDAPHVALASVASPGDSCTNYLTPYLFDWSILPSGTHTANAVFCNSGSLASVMTIQSTGNVGIGTTSPQTTLQVSGSIMMGTGTCSITTAGSIQYSGGAVQYCNGTSWANISSGGGSGSTGYDAIWTSATTIGTGLLFESGGKVGIGTASPNNLLELSGGPVRDFGNNGTIQLTPTSTAHFPSILFGGQDINNQSSLIWTNDTTGNSGNKIGAIIWAVPTSATNSDISFYTNNAVGTSNPSEKFRITGAGNVGIGTTSPAYPLDIRGPTQIVYAGSKSSSALFIAASATTGNYLQMYVDSGNGGTAHINTSYWTTDGPLQLGTYTTPGTITLLPSGNVGIGTASPVGALNIYSNVVRDDGWHSALEITSTGSNNFPSLFFSGQTSNTNYSAIVWTASTSGNNLNKIGATIAALPTSSTDLDLQFYTNNAVGSATATEKMRITGGGNVGIGTTSPQTTLQVSGSIMMGTGTCSITTAGSIQYSGGAVQYCNGTSWANISSGGGSGSTGYDAIWTSATTIGTGLLFESGGKVGIGTASPQNLLDVNGAASIGYNVAAPSGGLIVSGVVNIGTSVSAGGSIFNVVGNATLSGVHFGVGFNGGGDIAIGGQATTLATSTKDYQTIAIGYGALWNQNYNGISYNTVVGDYAMRYATTTQYSTAVGEEALANASFNGNGETAIGYYAGSGVTTGNYNIAIGYEAGSGGNIGTGANNIVIGENVDVPTVNASNQLNIGNLIYATGLSSGGTLSTGNVGIGIASPGASTLLNVAGMGLFTGGSYNPGDGTAAGVEVGYNTASGYGFIQSAHTGVAWEPLVLQPGSGNLGIGTTSPGTTLDVNGLIR